MKKIRLTQKLCMIITVLFLTTGFAFAADDSWTGGTGHGGESVTTVDDVEIEGTLNAENGITTPNYVEANGFIAEEDLLNVFDAGVGFVRLIEGGDPENLLDYRYWSLYQASGRYTDTGQAEANSFSIASGIGNLSGLASMDIPFTILDSGNVGIGTVEPDAKLEVVGNVILTDEDTEDPDPVKITSNGDICIGNCN